MSQSDNHTYVYSELSADDKGNYNIDPSKLQYHSGFNNTFISEALVHSVPVGQNNPQKCPYNTYAEQLSGTSFTTPRAHNRRTWLYRIIPTCVHQPYQLLSSEQSKYISTEFTSIKSAKSITPNQLRWLPAEFPRDPTTFLQGIHTVCSSGTPEQKSGLAIHIYTCNQSMINTAHVNNDGDYLIVPQQGNLTIRTEFGILHVQPREICVIQRGMTFSVSVSGDTRGYILEVYNSHFELPELGPIGANGLANARDFGAPHASYENNTQHYNIINKYANQFYHTVRDCSPYDVVGWHGNYVPYKYDLNKFCPAGAVLFDHMDPSIFTVLTCASDTPGVAVADFVIFPPRYAVQEHTFRPPYYHRNVMSEYMGNICGSYEAKQGAFLPGGASLHSCGIGHGPDRATFDKASTEQQVPVRMPDHSLSFMFETTYMLETSEYAMVAERLDVDYYKCWEPLQRNFTPNQI